MKGNETTGAQGQALQLLFTYQGLAEESGSVRDASLLLALKADGAPNFLASAVINFPVIDQKTVLFSMTSSHTGDTKKSGCVFWRRQKPLPNHTDTGTSTSAPDGRRRTS